MDLSDNCFTHGQFYVARSRTGAAPRGASQARTVFIKKCILLTKNAYYNMYYHTTRTSSGVFTGGGRGTEPPPEPLQKIKKLTTILTYLQNWVC
jgi:hypothetical protein